uniref:KAT8 regulatory NSL complex subunit 1-like n=1 Tax=Sinocyclocheilus grahami TaxID=75366 RepID=A0A672PP00_SINGR
MAAMAPALTDAPAEARHIRFKLASPSSTLSPGSTENNSNASNILISDSGQEQEPLSNAPSLGKLATYLCSDVKPLPSSTKVKESLKLQGVLIKQSVLKSHGLLSGSIFPSAAAGSDFLLRKRHTLELTRGQLKSLVNGAGAGSTMVPVNGLSKKVAVPSAAVAEKGSVATVNGDSNQPSTNGEAFCAFDPHRKYASNLRGFFLIYIFPPRTTNIHLQLGLYLEKNPQIQKNTKNVNTRKKFDTFFFSLMKKKSDFKIWRRAEGRFARERATIISHWTWLQAQISDLEYRIRQQVDIYRQLRSSKVSRRLMSTVFVGVLYHHGIILFVSLAKTGFYIVSSFSYFSSVAEVSDTCLSSLDSSCTSARTRPLLTCRRRRLIHPNTVHNLNSKVCLVSFSPPSVCEVNGLCVMCDSAPPLSKPDLPFNRPLLERVAHQDRSIHPVLSMQSDVALSLQLKKVLRSHWQTRPFDRIKPLKKISLKHKLSITPSSSFLSKHKFRLSNSHAAAVRLARHKSRSQRLHRLQVDNILCVPKLETLTPCRPDRVLHQSHSRKRVREHSLDRADCECNAFHTNMTLNILHSSNTSPLTRQLSLPVESRTPLGNSVVRSLFSPVRRRRGESPFDINNIVIPMSVAATTRVEKLQYKEILTPRWREVDILVKPLAEEDNNIPDLSEGAFAKLHQTLEDQERSRWRWTALAPAKRRGSRYLSYKSLDGRTTPSIVGTNPSTPQPSSPDASHFHLLQDYGLVQSPLSPPSPDTPCSRDAHTPHTRDTHRLLYSEDTCGSTSDCTFEEMVTYTHSHLAPTVVHGSSSGRMTYEVSFCACAAQK